MELAVYAHPWDLRALHRDGGLARLRELGFGEVALAVAYHAGRWLAPWDPERRVRFLEDGTVHFRPRADYGELQPLVSSEVRDGEPSPLEWLCTQARAAGLRARAWVVGTHNTRLGLRHRAQCVENAFGDRYSYALCPAQPAVQRYLRALVLDVAAHEGLGSVELEAFGWMGFRHSSHHDKASFRAPGLLGHALSLCFCEACVRACAAAGTDPEAARRACRELVRAHVTDADAMAPPAAGGTSAERAAEAFEVPRSARISVLAGFARGLRAALPAGSPALAVQVHPDPLFAGSQMQVRQSQGFAGGDERVLTCYGEGPAAIEGLLQEPDLRLVQAAPRRLSLWPKAPEFTSDDDLRSVRALCERHGISAIAVYHLGLLPWRTIERAARVLAA